VLASDISRPSISLVSSPPNAFTADPLCEAKGNWRDWKWAMEGTIGLTPLWDYIQGYVPCPNPEREPRAYRHWMSNDRMARLYINSAMDLDEAKAMNVRDIKPATALWATLQKKYENLGAVNQFSLLEQVFSTDLEDGDNLLKSFNAAVELATRAYGSKLSKNTFQVLALTRMISRIPSLSHIKTTIYNPEPLDYDEEDIYQPPEPQVPEAPPLQPPPQNPQPQPPKRSSRIASAATNGTVTQAERLQHAVQEAREAAARRKHSLSQTPMTPSP
ncbi:hypothetical protein CVT24_011810, partial [Panaeolus cyanescens]